ncbi:MAG: tetratricopeptide repeat protein [Ktedonobacteraceae bacterium]|nr:tetratricopeptide repeat protein [Ktedonobacteraceae bacterium]
MANRKKSRPVPNRLLQQERERQNWTQLRLATEIGTTPFNVSRWERGLTSPGPYFRGKLCTVFRKRPEELGLLRFTTDEPEDAVEDRTDPLLGAAALPVVYDSSIPSVSTATSGLVGRADLLQRLTHTLLTQRGALALSGLPGVGKTALAVALARDRQVQASFHEGVLWAGLGNRPNLVGLLGHWGSLLGIPAHEMMKLTRVEEWAMALRDIIGVRRMLLIIDDAWSIEAALACKVGGPNSIYVLTTRFPELAYQFAQEQAMAVHELSAADGIAFLAQLAPEITARETEDTRELVESVGGLPLALTLIGKYLQTQLYSGQPRRLQTALSRLRSANERLQLEAPQAPAEHSPSLPSGTPISLKAVIQVSDQQLSQQAQHALRSLAAFPAKPNTFSEEAALAVCAAPVEVLDELFSAGLLESSMPGRYTLHQTIADYAKLHGTDATSEECLIAYFVSYVEAYSRGYDYGVFTLESNNILAALQSACNRQMNAELIRGINAFAPFLAATGHYSVAETHLQQARSAALQSGDKHGLAEIWFHLGRLAENRGEHTHAELAYQQGLALARKIGRRDLMSAILAHWGELIVNSGDYPRAEHYLLEGLDLAREFDDKLRMSVLMKNLGEVSDCKGNYELGDSYYQQGLALARETGNREILSALLQNLGVKARRRGEQDLASKFYQEGIKWAREIGHRQRLSALLMNMGVLALQQQQFDEAERLFLESLDLARKIGHPLRISAVLQNLGMLEGMRHTYKRAEVYLQESLDLAYRIENRWLISEALSQWGELYLQQQRLDEARQAFDEALTIARNMKAVELIGITLHGLARVSAARGNYVDARRYGQESQARYTYVDHQKAAEIQAWLASLPIP